MNLRTTVQSVKVPAGDYFVGDPCYAFTSVDHSFWMQLLESCNYFKDMEGTVSMYGTKWTVVASPTAYGDGVYDSDMGLEFPVDAGLIGVVPKELVDLNEDGKPFGMALMNFSHDFTFHAVDEDGIITIGGLDVFTDDTPGDRL